MNSEFLSVVQNLQCQTTNDFLPSEQLQEFLSTLSHPVYPIESFQPPFFDEGALDDSLGSRSPFSDYASEDSFVDVMSAVPCPAPDQEDARRQRLARKAELARANRKRKKQNNSSFNNFDEGDSDSSTSGSRSPPSDCTDMSMSPGPQPTNWDLDNDDVRRKRLARKAELARVSRKKKRDRIDELESQLSQVQNELRIARQTCVAIKSEPCKPETENGYTAAYPKQSHSPTSDRLNQAMSNFADPNYLGAFYTAFIDKIREDMTQIDQLQTSMQSSLCLRFVQWIMNQSDKFYDDPAGLWYSLFSQEVGASATQLAQLLDLRKEFAQKQVISGPDVVSQAFDALRKAMDDSSRMMGAFAQIFSPAQLVQFFQWVERFGPVCIKINL